MLAWAGLFAEHGIWIRPSPSASLELARSDLQMHIADFAGLAREVPTGTDDLSRVNEAIKIGLRQFYYPAMVLGGESVHTWSFLHPVSRLYTEAGVWQYTLPSDFGMLVGDITYVDPVGPRVIQVRGESFIRQRRRLSSTSGYPAYAATRIKKIDGDIGNVSELILYPTAGDEYPLDYQYEVTPIALTEANPYPLGGARHAETIMQSCRAAADKIFNDSVDKEHTLFLAALATSISMDRRVGAPERLGYLYDPRVRHRRFCPTRSEDEIPSVEFNGTVIQ